MFNPATRALLGAAFLVFMTAQGFAAPPTVTPISAADDEWRLLSHRSHIAAQQHIVTSDGRRLSGSQINYAKVLIDRAEGAYVAARYSEALGYAGEARTLLWPTSP